MDRNPDPNPNDLLPRYLVDFKETSDLIRQITVDYVKRIEFHPNAKLEIESKLGYEVAGDSAEVERVKKLSN